MNKGTDSPLDFLQKVPTGELFQQFFRSVPTAVAVFDTEMRYVAASDRWIVDYGLEGEELIGRSHYDVFHEIPDRWRRIHARCLRGHSDGCEEDSFRRRDGSTEWVKWQIHPWRRKDGRIGGIVVYTEVITANKERELELRLRTEAVEASADGLVILDASQASNPRVVFSNAAARRLTGHGGEELFGQPHSALFGEPLGEALAAARDRCRVDSLRRHRDQDGGEKWSALSIVPFTDDQGALYLIVTITDMTAAKEKEKELNQTLQFNSMILETVGALVVVLDDAGRVVSFNRACEEASGYSASEAAGRKIWDFLIPADQAEGVQEEFARLVSGGSSVLPNHYENDWVARSGERRRIRWSSAIVGNPGKGGEGVEYVIGTGIDITERIEAEQRLRLALEAVQDDLWDWRLDTGRMYCGSLWSRLGYPSEQVEESFEFLRRQLHPEDRRAFTQALGSYLSNGDGAFSAEFRIRDRSGDWRWLTARSRVTERSEGGRPHRVLGTFSDSTMRKKMENQLIQAQKMEAVGQLTGGLAHDFKNLLGVVTGSLELIEDGLERPDSGRDTKRLVALARQSAEGGAKIVSRLLSFSRTRDLDPQQVRLDQLLHGMGDLLTSTIGPGIHLEIDAERASHVRVDPAQLENAVLNLVLNARDAMDGQGHIVVETRNRHFPDGLDLKERQDSERLVELAVTDSGCGMPPDVRKQALEPFFTTKRDQGTGLGLSMVHSFVTQSGGTLKIYSEPGQGTTVKLYFPPAPAFPEDGPDAGETPRGSETLLLAEDDQGLQAVVKGMLRGFGYDVLTASDKDSALRLLDQPGEKRISLLISDLVMGGGTAGAEIHEAVRRDFAEIPVLVMSGFGETALRRRLGRNAQVISKPFAASTLARKIRSVLDSARQAEAAAS